MNGLCVGQRIRVQGLSGTFTVVRVYALHGTADLELADGFTKSQMHLPIRLMRPVGEDVDQAAIQVNTLKIC